MDLSLAVKKGDAPKVLGVGRRSFEKNIFPMLKTYPMGNTVLIDRVELMEAWEDYKRGCTGRPQITEGNKCPKATISTRKASSSSTSSTSVSAFSQQLATAKARKVK